jgi:mono/diheme cytochrome c family protein
MHLQGVLLSILALPLAAQAPAPRDLRLFFQQNCVRCHGADGAARDEAGKKLRGQDLTDEKWARKTSDEDMVDAILTGKFFGRAMPAFKKQLSPEEARRLVVEVVRKTQKGKAIEPEQAP